MCVSVLQNELCELHHEVAHAAEDIASLRSEVRELQERDEAQVDTITDLKTENKRLKSRMRELHVFDSNHGTPLSARQVFQVAPLKAEETKNRKM